MSQQSARRAVRLLFVLQGHVVDGLRLAQIAEAMQASSPTTLRDLQMLEEEAIAERIPGRDEYWRLAPRVVQISRAHDLEMARHVERITEIQQRYSRDPN